MTRRVVVRAPAKINWTLEVLGKRPDGYHEIRSVMQTIDLCDFVDLEPADELSLRITGAEATNTPLAQNLVLLGAEALRERAGCSDGAHITLQKEVPVAAGLGGGSSDAAAVLCGLSRLWGLSIAEEQVAAIAANLGSDVPFLLRGGSAVASGRGEQIEALPDMRPQYVIIVQPRAAVREDKTARMYAALRPEHYTDGSRTERLAERIRQGEPVRDEDCFNVFELVLPEVDPEAAARLEEERRVGRWPHLCGSGPAYFTLSRGGSRTLSAAEATAVYGRPDYG